MPVGLIRLITAEGLIDASLSCLWRRWLDSKAGLGLYGCSELEALMKKSLDLSELKASCRRHDSDASDVAS